MDTLHHRTEGAAADTTQVVTLTAVGINGSTGVTKGLHQVDILVSVPLEGVEVVVYEDGIRPALGSQFEGLDNPVVACLATATQGFLDQIGLSLMAIDGLVDHVNHLQVGEMRLYLVHPIDDGLIAFLY